MNHTYDELLKELRSQATNARWNARNCEMEAKNYDLKADELEAVIFRLRPKCAVCFKFLDDDTISHASCYDDNVSDRLPPLTPLDTVFPDA